MRFSGFELMDVISQFKFRLNKIKSKIFFIDINNICPRIGYLNICNDLKQLITLPYSPLTRKYLDQIFTYKWQHPIHVKVTPDQIRRKLKLFKSYKYVYILF